MGLELSPVDYQMYVIYFIIDLNEDSRNLGVEVAGGKNNKLLSGPHTPGEHHPSAILYLLS